MTVRRRSESEFRRGTFAAAALVALAMSGCAVGFPGSPTYVSDTGATLNGTVFSNRGDTTYWFRYGAPSGYGSETAHRAIAIADGGPHPISVPLAGLAPGTTYHYQLCVKDADDGPPRICSENRTLLTQPAGGMSAIAFLSAPNSRCCEIYRMEADGSNPVALTNSTQFYWGKPSWSPGGTQLTFAQGLLNEPPWQAVYVMNADGSGVYPITDFYAEDAYPAWSPDGTRIALSSDRDHYDEIYVMGADGNDAVRVTNNPAFDYEPAWSPDGTKIAFVSSRDGYDEIYVMTAAGGNLTRLTNNDAYDADPAWSPDGTRIAFRSARNGNDEIYAMDADGNDPLRLTNNAASDAEPTWSPDGTKIAFARDGEIYVMGADGSSPTRLTTSAARDFAPSWSPRPPAGG